jgi:hypothetical protein
MPTFTEVTCPAEIIVPGSMRRVERQYIGDGATTFKKGDLIRLTSAGQVKDAAVDSDTAGAIHGMILKDYATAPAATELVPVLLFGSDTVVRFQIYAAAGADAQEQDITIGTKLELRNHAAGIWAITTTTTKGIATVVAKPSNVKWMDPDYSDITASFGFVDVTFAQAILDGRAA